MYVCLQAKGADHSPIFPQGCVFVSFGRVVCPAAAPVGLGLASGDACMHAGHALPTMCERERGVCVSGLAPKQALPPLGGCMCTHTSSCSTQKLPRQGASSCTLLGTFGRTLLQTVVGGSRLSVGTATWQPRLLHKSVSCMEVLAR